MSTDHEGRPVHRRSLQAIHSAPADGARCQLAVVSFPSFVFMTVEAVMGDARSRFLGFVGCAAFEGSQIVAVDCTATSSAIDFLPPLAFGLFDAAVARH